MGSTWHKHTPFQSRVLTTLRLVIPLPPSPGTALISKLNSHSANMQHRNYQRLFRLPKKVPNTTTTTTPNPSTLLEGEGAHSQSLISPSDFYASFSPSLCLSLFRSPAVAVVLSSPAFGVPLVNLVSLTF